MNKNFPVFIISLKRDVERRAKISKILADTNINYEFFDAVDYRSELFQSKKRNVSVNSAKVYGEMTEPEMACTLSHHGVYQKILDNDFKWALILEDDVSFDSRLAAVVHALSQSTDILKNGCTYVLGGQQGTSDHQLFGLSLLNVTSIGPVKFRKATYKKHKVTRTCCYIVDKRYCQRALSLLSTHGFYLVDDRKILLDNGVMDNIYFCDIVSHPLVNSSNSHLENSRINKTKQTKVKKRNHLVSRLLLWRYKLRVLLGSFI
ncbi:glycosyltransferase family 25 protein [Citrobacter werkmanii]|uniref:glycosyltransferase family 25 protein n=1 Tax=Citrobacter werkmanii TaxID=67827 RepID=UPI001D0BA598|nr:glycosyltransferase family 25 protein [Citrobacter werkmanii]UBX44915.1 glycosyltransferase family 25 protein [Citrobacter werkmanii]